MTEVRCSRHSGREAVGYCVVCGEFGCADCLTAHEGLLYCARDFAPIQAKQSAAERETALRKKPDRQRLVVHMKDGHLHYGTCYALNIADDGFHLHLCDRRGRQEMTTRRFRYEELNAVFYVKSFDGHGGGSSAEVATWRPEGNALVVEFLDGEILEGHCHRAYRAADARFFLIPDDPSSNNISVLVERTGVKTVHTPEGFKVRWQEEIETFLRQHRETGYSKPELMGDFFFSRHDYGRAMRQYRYAHDAEPENQRVRKKMVATEYNIGIRYVKHHDYERALHCMQQVLQADPQNARAAEKIEQIERHLKRHDTPRPSGPETEIR